MKKEHLNWNQVVDRTSLLLFFSLRNLLRWFKYAHSCSVPSLFRSRESDSMGFSEDYPYWAHTHTHNKITVHVEASHSWGKINSDKYQWIIANKPGKRGLGTSTNEQKMNIHLLNKIVKFIENLKYAIAFKFELKIIFHSINLLAQCDRRSLVIRIFLFHFLIVRLYFHAAFSPSLSRLKFSRSTEWVR